MRRYAPSTALTFALTAAAFCLAPLRADAEKFTFELEAAVREIMQDTEHRMRSNPSSVMFKDMHAHVINVSDQLLLRNEQLKKKKTPVDERLPILRELYFTEMRKIHDLTPDGASSVKYNERTQTLMCYHYHITPSGSSGSGGGGTFAHRLNSLLAFNMVEDDPFALNLNAALSHLENNWRSFQHTHFRILSGHIHGHFHGGPSSGTSMIPPFLSGLTSTSASISPLKYPRGVASMVEDIGYELSKLDVELSLKGKSDEERAEELRGKLIEIVKEFDKLTPTVQFDKEAGELLFFDSSGSRQMNSFGSPLTYKIPFVLISALNMHTANNGMNPRMRRFMIGAGAVLLLLFGGIYLAMKFSSSEEENENAEGG